MGDALRGAAAAAGFEVHGRPAARASIGPPSQSELPAASSVVAPEPRVSEPRVSDVRLSFPSEVTSTDPLPTVEPEDLSVAGLPRLTPRRGGTWKMVGVAFLIGAALVGGGFAVSRGFFRAVPPAPAVDLEELAHQARQALGRGQYDEPRAGSVLELTDRMLAAQADHAEALRLRQEVAARLVRRAAEHAERGQIEDARALYTRARAFRPGDADIQQALAALDQPAEPAVPAGVRAEPTPVVERVGTTLTVTLEPSVQVGARARPRFVIKQGSRQIGRSIDATLGSDGRTYTAQAVFPSDGTYRVFFRVGTGGDRIELSTDLEVQERTRPVRRIPADPPPVTTQGSSWSPAIVPAWEPTPAVVQAPPPDPPPAPDPPPPPAPWTGGGSVL